MPKKEKKASPSAIKDMAVRGLLIVLSILLALFLNEIRDQQKVTADLKSAYRSIRIEVENNRDALAAATEYHSKCIAALDSLLQKNSRNMAGTEFAAILSQIFPNEHHLPTLQNAAWNTLHLMGFISHLKFDDAYPFVKLYGSQKAGVERVSHEIREFLSQPELFDKQVNTANLKTLRLHLNELYEQEKRLLNETNTVLNAGQNWRYLE